MRHPKTHCPGSRLLELALVLAVLMIFQQGLFAGESSLFPCPDCGKKVSRRAIMCPECGCPGAAIQEVVRLDDERKRPKRLVSVSSDLRKSVAVLVRQGESYYVVMDSSLIADATSLNITELGTDKVIGYSEPELASNAPLLRFKIIGQPYAEFLPIPAASTKKEPTILLNPSDQPVGSAQPTEVAVAALDESGALVAVHAAGSWNTIHGGLIWTGAKPAELRAQIDLLSRARETSKTNTLSDDDATALAGTNWLTPYLKNQSSEILQTNKKASEP